MGSDRADIVFAGGGLASCLAALRIAEEIPDCAIAIIETSRQICGNHTWSFHETDVPRRDLERLKPMVAKSWAGQRVRFPKFDRFLTTPYYSMTSETLRRAVYAAPSITVRENCNIVGLDDQRVTLASGTHINASCVIDARGFTPSDALSLGFQKFIGLEVVLSTPHGETVPTIMDADVTQRDGYRFLYVLPLSPDRVLIEDTRYSDEGDLDEDAVHQDVLTYVMNRGWDIAKSERIERGVLPIALAHDVQRYWQAHERGAAPIGLRAGLFHPTTGYSLPDSVNVANLIATECKPLTTNTVRQTVRAHAIQRNREQAFYRMLNRLLFGAAEPDRRYLVLQRFYMLPQGLIERFYAGRLTILDKARILAGKPPVPIRRALRFVEEPKPLALND